MPNREGPFRITYALDLFQGSQQKELSQASLHVLLRALTLVDRLYLRSHPKAPLLYDSGVRYEMEEAGVEDWQDIPTTLARRFGDCEDLATWRAAELQERFGVQAWPAFTYRVRPNGSYLYHIIVRLPDGSTEDPSRRLGMR